MANDDLPPSLMPDSTQIPSGTMIIDGTYRIEKHLNTGGMGEVYRGENVHLGEPVAIKVVLPALAHDPKIVSLFQKEAAVLRRLNHEAIVRYEGFFVDSGIKRPCLVMEFVEGVSLADHLHHGPMAVDQVFTLIERVASGLAAAHKLGVVHRDLSPDNVILQDGAVENAKIIDFGIAKAANVGKGRTLIGDNFAGKFGYVAPEQLGKYNREVTARSDIYALGLLAAAACRGEPLDMGDDFYLALERRNTVPDLTEVDPAIRPLVEWMLQPDPKDRPQDMNAVLAALPGAAQGTRPPGTMPPPASLPPHTMPPVSAPPAPEPSVPPASLAPAPPPSAPPVAPPETTTLASAPPASVPPPPQTTTVATAPPAAPPSVPPAAPPETTTLASIPPAAPRAPTVFMPSAPPVAAAPPSAPPASVPPASAPPAATAFMPTPPARSVPPAAPAGQGSESPFGAAPAPAAAPAAAPVAPAPAKGGRGGLMAAVAVVALAAVGGGLWFGGVIPHGGSTPAGQTAAVKPPAQPPVTPPPATGTTVETPAAEKPAEPAKPAAEPPAPPPAPVQQAAQQPQPPAPEPAKPEPAKPEPAKPEPPKTEQPKPEPAKTAALSPLQQSLNAFGTQPCAFAEPAGSSGAVTAYAGKAMTVAALQRTLTGVEGKVPDLTAHLVNEAQCPVLQLAAAARSTAAAATPISVTLDRTMLANADRITGSVKVPAGQPVALLMIDGNGIAYNLTAGLTRQADGSAGFSTSFSLPALGNRPRRMPLLFLAATSAGPFDAAGVGAASSAQAVGPALKDALAKGAQVAIGFAQFTFR